MIKITMLSLLSHLLMNATVQFVSIHLKIKFVFKQYAVEITSALIVLLDSKIWEPHVHSAVVTLILQKINFLLVSS